jgi:tRNA pseudouridine65 synthase
MFGKGVTEIKRFVLDASFYLLFLAKPFGIKSHPNFPYHSDKHSLFYAPYDIKRECFLPPNDDPIFLLHRLDAATSGVIAVTNSPEYAKECKQLFSQHLIKKNYTAIVCGKALEGTDVWKENIQGKFCQTSITSTLYDSGSNVSLVKFHPLTGRKHQLRIQCSRRKLPILGDKIYGDFAINKSMKIKRMFLHCEEIIIPRGGNTPFIGYCPIPSQFYSFFRGISN